MKTLTVSSLAFEYPNLEGKVFDNLSLQLENGEIVCLVGPSGCGKTTLLNVIAGFLRPNAGQIEHLNAKASGANLGYIFQTDALLPWRTIQENIALPAEIRGTRSGAMDQEILSQLEAFKLEPTILSKYPAQLSGGMRQRISLIQCLMSDPPLLLLDEPFASLDFLTKLKLEGDLRQLVAGKSRSALFVTHDIDEAIAIADRILVMGRNPTGIVAEIPIALEARADLSPQAIRAHPQFGHYFAEVWKELRHAI